MESFVGVLVLILLVWLAVAFAVGVFVWAEVRPLKSWLARRRLARSGRPAADARPSGRTAYGA